MPTDTAQLWYEQDQHRQADYASTLNAAEHRAEEYWADSDSLCGALDDTVISRATIAALRNLRTLVNSSKPCSRIVLEGSALAVLDQFQAAVVGHIIENEDWL